MRSNSSRVAELLEPFKGREFDPHYLAFFDCFNRQLFYEAHEVLEPLWLANRKNAEGAFYKGLIQLTAAFVHLQKGRKQPADALFQLAAQNLRSYPETYHSLDVRGVLGLITDWRAKMTSEPPTKAALQTADDVKLQLLQGNY